ncbi:MAG: transposase [Bacteroidales bacterium]|nr:transposase [Bacteroidales bacterium]
MFRKSNKDRQLDVFSSVTSQLESTAYKQYSDQGHWHNQFREQISLRIDESIFSVLFNNNMGAPNAPIRILVAMMILKESFGWSDSQLFEHCRFNLLMRSALGLFNMNDSLPVESTYYLFRKRIYDYQKQNGIDLMENVFGQITSEQIKEFEVNGSRIRMDSKLIGSNIAVFSRYEIIHHTLCMFFNSLDIHTKTKLQITDLEQLTKLTKEESNKTVYRSTKEDIKNRLKPIGILIYKMLKLYGDLKTDLFYLLKRVFDEQYKVSEEGQIELRPKEKISSSSVQSPHDPDSAFRSKGNQKIKGYSVNVTETCSNDGLNLITNVIVDKANKADTAFVKPAIKATIKITDQSIKKVFADGAYHSPANDDICKNIDMIFTGIQGAKSRYDLEMTPEGLMVTDTYTGEQMKAVLVKKRKNNKEDRWRIKTPNGYYYFGQQAIRASRIRHKMKGRSLEEMRKRNNVEATIFQLSCTLRNNKSKYRSLIKQKMWTCCRCLWINLVRIINFSRQTCLKTAAMAEKLAILTFSSLLLTIWQRAIRKINDCGNQLFITVSFNLSNSFYKFLRLI